MGVLDQVSVLFPGKAFGSGILQNLAGRIPSPSRSQMLSPKITSQFFIILGDRFESKNLFLKFLVNKEVLVLSAKLKNLIHLSHGFKIRKRQVSVANSVLQRPVSCRKGSVSTAKRVNQNYVSCRKRSHQQNKKLVSILDFTSSEPVSQPPKTRLECILNNHHEF